MLGFSGVVVSQVIAILPDCFLFVEVVKFMVCLINVGSVKVIFGSLLLAGK